MRSEKAKRYSQGLAYSVLKLGYTAVKSKPMGNTSSQSIINCALHSELDAIRRRGRNMLSQA